MSYAVLGRFLGAAPSGQSDWIVLIETNDCHEAMGFFANAATDRDKDLIVFAHASEVWCACRVVALRNCVTEVLRDLLDMKFENLVAMVCEFNRALPSAV